MWRFAVVAYALRVPTVRLAAGGAEFPLAGLGMCCRESANGLAAAKSVAESAGKTGYSSEFCSRCRVGLPISLPHCFLHVRQSSSVDCELHLLFPLRVSHSVNQRVSA